MHHNSNPNLHTIPSNGCTVNKTTHFCRERTHVYLFSIERGAVPLIIPILLFYNVTVLPSHLLCIMRYVDIII